MTRIKTIFSQRYSPMFKMVIQVLLIFILITLPLSFNITSSKPPYSIKDTGPGGLSIFSDQLRQEGYTTTRTILSTNPVRNLPDSSILVITGGSKLYQEIEIIEIDAFVAQGGILLLLTGGRPTIELARYFGVYISSSFVLETESYYKSPEIILVDSPFIQNSTLCLARTHAISYVAENSQQRELFAVSTQSTAFIDADNDGIWSETGEPTEQLKIATAFRRGLGAVIIVSSLSFLTNDLYEKGFDNIELALYVLNYYSSGSEKLVCFEESHKRWPFASTDGIINQSYGTIILLTKTKLFVFLMVLIILFLYYLSPRFSDIFGITKETYKQFLSDRIWSRKRELYETFGSPVKPTVEEKYLSSLYFQYELYPNHAYNFYLEEKLRYIPTHLFTSEEKELLEQALRKKLDNETFLSLFFKLEEIQKRGRLL